MWELIGSLGNTASPVMNWLIEPLTHFSVPFCLASLAALLTLTTSYADLKTMLHSGRSRTFMDARRGTIRFWLSVCLLVGLSVCVGLLSHVWLDLFSQWATTPLNPPLNIIK